MMKYLQIIVGQNLNIFVGFKSVFAESVNYSTEYESVMTATC